MSRLQDLVINLVQVIAKYHSSQTEKEHDLDALCRMSDADLHFQLYALNNDPSIERSTRKSLFAYILATIDIIRPLVNSGELLTAGEESKVERILSSFLANLFTLLSSKHNNTHTITVDQVGMIKLSSDPQSMPRDMLYKMLPDQFTYIQFGSHFFYLEKHVGLVSVTPNPSVQLEKLFPAEFDSPTVATPARLAAIKETTGHDCSNSQITVYGMVSPYRFTQSWQTVTSEFIGPMDLNPKSTEFEIRNLVRAWISEHRNSLQSVALAQELRQVTETSTAEINSLQRELVHLKQEHALTLREKESEIAQLKTKLGVAEREIGELRIQNSELRLKKDPISQVKNYEAASTAAFLTRSGLFAPERPLTGSFFSRVMFSGDSPTGPSSP